MEDDQKIILKNLLDDISQIKNIKNPEKFNEVMKDLNKKAQAFPLTNIQKFTLMFYSYYNDINCKKKNNENKKLIRLSNYMIENISNQNILPFIQREINENFTSDFRNYKIFANKKKQKDELEICFSICILSKNIKLMEIFFKEYLKICVFGNNNFNSINLENPFATNLLDSIFNKVYESIKNKQTEKINSIVKKCIGESNISINNIFHCNKCYDIVKMKLNKKNNFESKCLNCDKNYKEYSEFAIHNKTLLDFTCVSCGNKIIMYEQNYKCTSCKKIVCSKCINEHLDNCFSLRFIKLYEVGYNCEIHNRKYIDFCFSCEKNLCENCIEIHPHKVKKMINIEENVIKLFEELHKLKELTNVTIYPNKYYLSYLYLINKKHNCFNGYLYEILCDILQINLKSTKEDILFSKFNDQDFQKYYSKLLKNAREGKIYYLKCLESIKPLYSKKQRIEFSINYNKIADSQCYTRNFIESCRIIWHELQTIHDSINYDSIINDLRISNYNLKIKIDELNTNLHIYKNSNKVFQENTHNLLCRFLSDELLQLIITNYHMKLDKISLNLSILIDLCSKSDYDIFSDKNIVHSILEISENFIKSLKELDKKYDISDKEIIKQQILKYLHSNQKIQFIDDIVIGEDIFKKEELNKILDILFFIKNKGNIIAHPNIDLDESLKIIETPKIPLKFEIDIFYNSLLKEKIEEKINKKLKNKNLKCDDNLPRLLNDEEDEEDYYTLNSTDLELKERYNLFKNLEDYKNGIFDELIEKIKTIRDDILSRLNISKIKKKVEIKDIIQTIFEGTQQKIFEEMKEFQRAFILSTDEIIKKYIKIDLEKKISKENNNINKLIKVLKDILLILPNFIELNIPKHNNMKKFINNRIKNNEFDYYSIQMEIQKFEITILKGFDTQLLDCEKDEIMAEFCFLLMVKTFENEINLLKNIKKNYESELIKSIIYEDIEQKLNEIQGKCEEEFDDNSFLITKSIKNNFFSDDNANNLTYERLKYILIKILDNNISLDQSKNSKLKIDPKLFYIQNSKKKNI